MYEYGHSRYTLPTRDDSTLGHNQMVNTKIRLIIFFAAQDGEALYSQQKQDRELTPRGIKKYLFILFESELFNYRNILK